MPKNFATHCDAEVLFFETEGEAVLHALHEIDISRREQRDGWDEELVEGIVVLQVIRRAEKVDPFADYRQVDYRLGSVRYPNHCLSPQVKACETREVAWSDEHPLNNRKTCDHAYLELFALQVVQPAPGNEFKLCHHCGMYALQQPDCPVCGTVAEFARQPQIVDPPPPCQHRVR